MKKTNTTNTTAVIEKPVFNEGISEYVKIYVENLETALKSDNTLVEIPVITSKLDDFKNVRIETYLPKAIKQQDMITWKNQVVIMSLHEQLELFNQKAKAFEESNTFNIDSDGHTWWTSNKTNDIVDSTFIDNYKTNIKTLENYFNYFKNLYAIDVDYLIKDNILLCMCNAIAGTPLPSEFSKNNKLFMFICDNAVVYFKNRNKNSQKEFDVKVLKETATRLKGFIIEFYQRYLKFNPTGNPSIDEMHEQLSGGCNMEMLNSITSAIYKGIQISKEGHFTRTYGNYNKMGLELSKCYLLYLQNEYTSNSKTAPRNDKKQEEKEK